MQQFLQLVQYLRINFDFDLISIICFFLFIGVVGKSDQLSLVLKSISKLTALKYYLLVWNL